MDIDEVPLPPPVTTNDSHVQASSDDDSSALVKAMIQACSEGNRSVVEQFLQQPGPTITTTMSNDDSEEVEAAMCYYASQQDVTTGQSPLMVAAYGGHLEICQLLLDRGAPWNAIDRYGQCAGNYAVAAHHWPVVNLLVDWGTKAELILSAATRWQRQQQPTQPLLSTELVTDNNNNSTTTSTPQRPVEHEPCTKPDYLRQKLHYKEKNSALIDRDGDAVMMEWERPLMELHASQLLGNDPLGRRKTVLNVGFGLGLIDRALQTYQPTLHVIIEAHPQVYQRMLEEGWDKKTGVQLEFGTWQEVLPRLLQQPGGFQVDAVFFDTYGEHFLDLEDFHNLLPHILSQPHGMYSFFNGLAPDNIFFHGVACNCVKLQLDQLGFQTEFWNCEMQGVIRPEAWVGVRRKYWHDDRDTYYLPAVTWKTTTTTSSAEATTSLDDTMTTTTTTTELASRKTKAASQDLMIDDDGDSGVGNNNIDSSVNNHYGNNSNSKRLRL